MDVAWNNLRLAVCGQGVSLAGTFFPRHRPPLGRTRLRVSQLSGRIRLLSRPRAMKGER
jgi:hypothetical protein